MFRQSQVAASYDQHQNLTDMLASEDTKKKKEKKEKVKLTPEQKKQ